MDSGHAAIHWSAGRPLPHGTRGSASELDATRAAISCGGGDGAATSSFIIAAEGGAGTMVTNARGSVHRGPAAAPPEGNDNSSFVDDGR